MKRAPMLASMLAVLAVLATSAFTHPLASRNGVVSSYSPGKSLTIQTGGIDMTYALRGNMFANVNGIGTGARVTVWAQCFGGQHSATAGAQQGLTASVPSSATSSSTGTVVEGNPNTCIAVFILVRSAATGVATTGGSSGGSPGGTAGGSSTGTSTPSVTPTPTP